MPSQTSRSTKAKYDKLNTDKSDLRNVPQIMFPENMLNGLGNGHFVIFNINRLGSSSYQDKNFTNNGNVISSGSSSPDFYGRGYSIQSQLKGGGGRYVRSNESIVLPMPDSVANSHGVDWNAVELGAAGMLARELSTYDQNSLGDLVNVGKEGLKNTVSGAIETLTGFNVKQTAELYTGTIQNPFLEMLFKGVKTRDPVFDYKFIPKNEKESKIIAEVIRRFKFHMHPEFKFKKSHSSYFLYPSTFDITYMVVQGGEAKRNVWLHKLTTCALVSLNEDSSVGGYAVHDDNSPVARKLSLSFQELSPLRKTDFESTEESY